MNPPPLLHRIVCAIVALLSLGCSGEVTSTKAYRAQHRHQITRLLHSLEDFQTRNGVLPATLEDLGKADPKIADIVFSDYLYAPRGIKVADGSTWLISVHDPVDTSHLVVGRLPTEVDSRRAMGK